jgi:2C-methyl-D-erythritol 2,4-cyclodiphosphate synthase
MAEITGISLERISVKAKTTDGLGFAGREEGVACYAIALLVRP